MGKRKNENETVKVDFSALLVEQNIDDYVDMNLCVAIGNAVYQRAQTVEQDKLARRIHGASGAIELTQEECNIVADVVNKVFTLPIRRAVAKQLGDRN